MIQSMTGYGKKELALDNTQLTLEIRTLNSKQGEVIFSSLPPALKNQKISLRNYLLKKLTRGKVTLSVYAQAQPTEDNHYSLNKSLLLSLYSQLEDILHDKKITDRGAVLASLLGHSEVITPPGKKLSDPNLEKFFHSLDLCIQEVVCFRQQEGVAIWEDIEANMQAIEGLIQQLGPYETERTEHLQKRLRERIAEYNIAGAVQNGRFEQELLYYIERLDINEEKVRLINHCRFFRDTATGKERVVGRKLTFITQEIGREITTLGNKSHSFNIQQLVVQMKDHMERVKEQLANVL